MEYIVPQHLDRNKIFIVSRTTIEERLDPHFNKPKYSELWQVLSSIPVELTTLGSHSICIFSGITPKSGGDAYVSDGGIPFVRSGDFSETNEIDFSTLLLIKEEVHKGIMRNSQLSKGDLLIAIVGATIGKIGVYQYDTEANINQAICSVRLKPILDPYYVQAFYQTRIGQQIIDRMKRPVARANLNLEEISRLPIPLFGRDRQEEIVKVMNKGRKLKQEKEAEARNLLESINDFLLGELGITMPESANGSIKNRMFYMRKANCPARLDPKYNRQMDFMQSLS